MIDWFILLTPILLLPITLLLYFLGCEPGTITGYRSAEAAFRITFYLDNDNLGHTYEFKIFDASSELDSSQAHTDQLEKLGGPGDSVQGTYQFTKIVTPGPFEFTCQVRDVDIIGDDGSPFLTIAQGPSCLMVIEDQEQYLIDFNAGVSADGTPNDQFELCEIEIS